MHEPYRLGREESLEECDRLLQRIKTQFQEHGATEEDFARWAGELRAFYDDGARDLDVKFQEWWQRLADLPDGRPSARSPPRRRRSPETAS